MSTPRKLAIEGEPVPPVTASWYEQIGDPTVADGILDRLVHSAAIKYLR